MDVCGTQPNILIVRKQRDERVLRAFDDIVSHLKSKYPEATVFSPSSDAALRRKCNKFSESRDPPKIDLVITLGGDGTILRASSLFKNGPVPPVLSFSLGTLGFLLPFHIDSFPRALQHVFEGKYTILHRMRLACRLLDRDGALMPTSPPEGYQLMNEVTIHRGRSPHLSIMDAFVDGQHLTEAVVRRSPSGVPEQLN
ncbi:hypothetical protein M407DRAFT_27837 [Tulasnella calospora MUT 4182]|uniref:ATP-NAD kinase n=1 Tax=Tulasnella calospora MUT 4182 TaxID=1051891 RepID=A0A0C3QBR1_9AGAM|nr:hypothetical protein M407DRAFT_27837 [Tulasnella calospora MUT 4182]